jgi:non-homologous end joining protein Ku
MEKEGQYAFAQVVLRDREQIVLVRPVGKLLAMTSLNYADSCLSAFPALSRMQSDERFAWTSRPT